MTRQVKCPCCGEPHECDVIKPNESVVKVTYDNLSRSYAQNPLGEMVAGAPPLVESWDEHR